MTLMFKVANYPTFYMAHVVGQSEATDVGCPKATHKLTSKYGTTYGEMCPSGRPRGAKVVVPGTPKGTYGVRMVFVVEGDDPLDPLDGYLID